MPSSLLSLLADGVVDLRLPRVSVIGSDNERDAGAGATGILSTVGPFMADRFAGALVATASEKRTANFERVRIDPRFVLAQPWRMRRTVEAIALREENNQPPAIQVDRVRFPSLPDLFTIIDGCHRTYAARSAGADLVEAQIHEELTCHPDMFLIEGRVLMRKTLADHVPVSPMAPWAGETSRDDAMLPIDLVMILQALGVRSVPEPKPHRFDLSRISGVTGASTGAGAAVSTQKVTFHAPCCPV